MEDRWRGEQESEEEDIPVAGLGYPSSAFFIDGVHFSADDCPDCLRRDVYECDVCTFYHPWTCRLRNKPFLMDEFRSLVGIWWEREAAQLRRQRDLIRAIRSELRAHGRPLHYTVLARIVADRHPELEVSEQRVLRTMARHTRLFERVDEGVYRYRHSRRRE